MRNLTHEGQEWVVWASGGGAYGTGTCGLGNVEAVHFARSEAPEIPVFEALLTAGRFESLHDVELIALFRTAKKVVDPASLPERPIGRKSLSG